MNEKGTEVLEQYDFAVTKTSRVRGAILCETDAGLKLLKEYHGNGKRILFEEELLQFLCQRGFREVDCPVRTKENNLLSFDEGRTAYIVKDWFSGRECDCRSLMDLKRGAVTLARLHSVMSETHLQEIDPARGAETMDLCGVFQKRNRSLTRIRTYLRSVTRKNRFERRALECYDLFLEQAREAERFMRESDYEKMYEEAKKRGSICHGNYNYHNIIIDRDRIAVTNFGGAFLGIQIVDFYDFLRKSMEKNNWNRDVGHALIDAYNRGRRIGEEEMELLARLLLYPEKFFKVMNFYMNSKKSHLSEKNMEKLESICRQQEKKMKFIEGIL